MNRPLAGSMRRTAKSLAQSAGRMRLRAASLATARAGIKRLEARRGPLAAATRAEIADYAAARLGGRAHVAWLELYTLVQGRFRPGWLPDDYYLCVAGPRVNGEYHHIARHRGANALVFDRAPFPDLGYWINGVFYDPAYRAVPVADVAAYLGARAETVVFKADRSGWGHGLRFANAAEVTPAVLARMGNAVCQRRLTPHPGFDRFGLPSLATLRFVTAVDGAGQASVRGCYLKLGRAGATHVRADDQVRVAVDPRSGRVADEGWLADWQPVARHPDSGAPFAGAPIPAVAEAGETVRALHRRNPLARLLCWDVAVDAGGGVNVLEWEGGVVSFAEATQGPCFADLEWDRFHHG